MNHVTNTRSVFLEFLHCHTFMGVLVKVSFRRHVLCKKEKNGTLRTEYIRNVGNV